MVDRGYQVRMSHLYIFFIKYWHQWRNWSNVDKESFDLITYLNGLKFRVGVYILEVLVSVYLKFIFQVKSLGVYNLKFSDYIFN